MPTSIQIGKVKKKNIGLGLNRYRNSHYMVSNNMKKAYKEAIKEQLLSFNIVEFPEEIELILTYFNWTKRVADLDNRCSIACKFAQDAFTELWLIEWDDYRYIKSVHFIYGGYDKNNWRVEIEIVDHNRKLRDDYKRNMSILGR